MGKEFLAYVEIDERNREKARKAAEALAARQAECDHVIGALYTDNDGSECRILASEFLEDPKVIEPRGPEVFVRNDFCPKCGKELDRDERK